MKSLLTGFSHSAASEMAGYRHTLNSCLSKLRSSLEAGKKQSRVWLRYACSVKKVLLYSSYGGPLVLLWYPFDDSYFSNKRVQGKLVFNLTSGRKSRMTTSRLFQKGLMNEVKSARKELMARNLTV